MADSFDPGSIAFSHAMGEVRAVCSFGPAFSITFHPNSPNASTITLLSPCCQAKLENSRFTRSHSCRKCLAFHYDLSLTELGSSSALTAEAVEPWVSPYFPPLETIVVAAGLAQKFERFRSSINRWSMPDAWRLSGPLA